MYLTYNVAEYFNSIVSLENKKILDFGCNHANFLRFGYQGDYTGVDVDKKIIEENKKEFTNYKFIHCNNHNNQYNVTNKKLKLTLDTRYEIICAFSVFTHTCFNEFKETIQNLKKYLSEDGKILATFIEIQDESSIRLMFDYRKDLLENIDIDTFLLNIKGCNTVSFAVSLETRNVDIYYNEFYINDYNSPTYFITMYNGNWLANNLDGKIVDVTKKFNDIRSAQKCIIL